MNCEEFGVLVHEVARDGALDAVTIDVALAHAEVCGTCDSLLQAAESLNSGIRSLAARHALEQAPAHVEKALLAKLTQQDVDALPFAGRRRFWQAAAAVASIAAAGVLFFSMVTYRGAPRPGGLSQPQTVVAAVAATDETGVTATTEENTASSFVALSPGFDSSLLDDGTVVRVVLSDAALESFGLPAGEVGRGPVTADLLLTSDGVPQAIHVVGW